MHFWMITCKQYAQLVSERMERHLPARHRLALKLHDWICPPCQKVARQFGFLREACRYVPPEEGAQVQDVLPPHACERIKCAMKACIQREAE